MAELRLDSKMETIKKVVSILFFVSLALGVATLVMLICFNFAGVFTIQTLPGTKYQTPFTYPGWQSIFYAVGQMIIQGYTEATFNIWTCIGLFLPAITIIVCSVIMLTNRKRKGTNMKKAIVEFVCAFCILLGTILLFNCDNLFIANASQVKDSYQNYYTEYLLPALNGEVSFTKEIYPTILLIVGIITSLAKVGNGLLLIYQKKYALSLKNRKENA